MADTSNETEAQRLAELVFPDKARELRTFRLTRYYDGGRTFGGLALGDCAIVTGGFHGIEEVLADPVVLARGASFRALRDGLRKFALARGIDIQRAK